MVASLTQKIQGKAVLPSRYMSIARTRKHLVSKAQERSRFVAVHGMCTRVGRNIGRRFRGLATQCHAWECSRGIRTCTGARPVIY